MKCQKCMERRAKLKAVAQKCIAEVRSRLTEVRSEKLSGENPAAEVRSAEVHSTAEVHSAPDRRSA